MSSVNFGHQFFSNFFFILYLLLFAPSEDHTRVRDFSILYYTARKQRKVKNKTTRRNKKNWRQTIKKREKRERVRRARFLKEQLLWCRAAARNWRLRDSLMLIFSNERAAVELYGAHHESHTARRTALTTNTRIYTCTKTQIHRRKAEGRSRRRSERDKGTAQYTERTGGEGEAGINQSSSAIYPANSANCTLFFFFF